MDQPDANQPDGNQPDANQPDANQPDANQPDGNQPDANQPDANQPDANQPDGNQPDANQPDAKDAAERFTASPYLPRDEEGPVFAEPWHAQAFAMAVHLSSQGHFTWHEWTTALGEQLQAAVGRGGPDDGSRYFEHWVAALEHLVARKKLTDLTALRERKEAWADAYYHTPHGQPVELGGKFRLTGPQAQ